MGAPYRRCLLHQRLFGAAVHLALLHHAAPVSLPAGAGGIYRIPGGWEEVGAAKVPLVLCLLRQGEGMEPPRALSRHWEGGGRQTVGSRTCQHPAPSARNPVGAAPWFLQPAQCMAAVAPRQGWAGAGWALCWPGMRCLGRDGQCPALAASTAAPAPGQSNASVAELRWHHPCQGRWGLPPDPPRGARQGHPAAASRARRRVCALTAVSTRGRSAVTHRIPPSLPPAAPEHGACCSAGSAAPVASLPRRALRALGRRSGLCLRCRALRAHRDQPRAQR